MTYEICDVTKTSLIGPRFLLEVTEPGVTSHSYHPSHEAAQTYFDRHVKPYIGWTSVEA